ncbi:MAG: hypothetical protein R8P61_35980 [Bacteroidia bacterium]|nr:hypothetical protein [Bacteroidia bacterium]
MEVKLRFIADLQDESNAGRSFRDDIENSLFSLQAEHPLLLKFSFRFN